MVLLFSDVDLDILILSGLIKIVTLSPVLIFGLSDKEISTGIILSVGLEQSISLKPSLQ